MVILIEVRVYHLSRTFLTIQAVVWTTSILHWISSFLRLFSKFLGSVPRATIGISATFMFHKCFISRGRSIYLAFPFHSVVWLKRQKQFLHIFIVKGFRTIVFIFIVISTTFRPICPLAFFRCLSNSGTYTEHATEDRQTMCRLKDCVINYEDKIVSFFGHLGYRSHFLFFF